MITDKDFTEGCNNIKNRAINLGLVDFTINTFEKVLYEIELDSYDRCLFGLSNLTPERAKILGFKELDNGVWLFPRWYAPMLSDGAIYTHVDADDWIYCSSIDDTACIDKSDMFFTFGVIFDKDGLVIA